MRELLLGGGDNRSRRRRRRGGNRGRGSGCVAGTDSILSLVDGGMRGVLGRSDYLLGCILRGVYGGGGLARGPELVVDFVEGVGSFAHASSGGVSGLGGDISRSILRGRSAGLCGITSGGGGILCGVGGLLDSGLEAAHCV